MWGAFYRPRGDSSVLKCLRKNEGNLPRRRSGTKATPAPLCQTASANGGFRPIPAISAGLRSAHLPRQNWLMDERKVLITPNGLGRISIVRRPDGMFCLYEHWRWSVEVQKAMKVEPVKDRRWTDTDYNRDALYEDVEPLPGLFASVEEAEREARGKEAFRDAVSDKAA